MTGVLLLGNSHAAALRPALRMKAEAREDLRCQFWGLPGGIFAKVVQDPDGYLRLPANDRLARKKSLTWQVMPELDPRPFDHILLVGLRFHHRALVKLLSKLWAWDWGRPPARADGSAYHAVSLRFVEALMAQEIGATLANQAARIPLDPRVVLMPAPYSGAVTCAAGALYEPATAALAQHPKAAELLLLFEAALISVSHARGLRLCLQPRESLAAPWLSDNRLLALPATDGRHLNDRYGQMALDAIFAIIGLMPPPAGNGATAAITAAKGPAQAYAPPPAPDGRSPADGASGS